MVICVPRVRPLVCKKSFYAPHDCNSTSCQPEGLIADCAGPCLPSAAAAGFGGGSGWRGCYMALQWLSQHIIAFFRQLGLGNSVHSK